MMFNVLLWAFDTEAGAALTLQTPIVDLVCDYFPGACDGFAFL